MFQITTKVVFLTKYTQNYYKIAVKKQGEKWLFIDILPKN